jgi:hypothetical protein
MHEAVRLRVGQGAQERGVDDAKDCSVRSDAEGQRENHHGGEAGRFGQQAKCEAEIVDHF